MNVVYKLHVHLIKTGNHTDPTSLRRLLLSSCTSSSSSSSSLEVLSYARALFADIPCPDTISYNTIIRAHAPSSPSLALSFFSRMRGHGVPLDHFTFPFVLKACSRLQLFHQDIHSLVIKLGFYSDVYVQNGLISFYGCCRWVECALKVFEEMLHRDLVSWSSMISCFVNNGFAQEALDLFRDMQTGANAEPDEVTMLSVIPAVSSLGVLELGRWLELYISRNRLEMTVSLGTALVDMYSRCGSVVDSLRVFDMMAERNVLTWTSLINGLAVHGCSKEALRAFDDMKKAGFKPDHITFNAVLVACSHGGLVDCGRRVFQSITDEYGMEPTLEHHGCIVDLLGRAGLLDEAFEFVERMPRKPNAVIWRILLGACVNRNNLVLAEKVQKKIYQLDPYHDGDYVLLSNAYGGAGRYVEKAEVRTSMQEKRVIKRPGYSMLIEGQEIHEFLSGDDSHPRIQEIRTFLDHVIESIRAVGYTPSTSNVFHDIEEEEKEHSLGYHSEKLAVAFALLSFDKHRTIRVMKNLRICQDCHSFMMHISSKFEKEIVVRDRNRFHHFRNGTCSCQDYW